MDSLHLRCKHFPVLFVLDKNIRIYLVMIHQPLRHTMPAMDCVVLYKIFGAGGGVDLLSAATGTQ